MKLVFQKTEWIFDGKILVMLMIKLKILTGMRSICGILSVLLILVCDPFILKFFTKQLPLMYFLIKIYRRNSPNCDFCDKFPESVIHIFCECDFVRPFWEELFKIIKDRYDIDFSASNFDKIFGVFGDKFLTYLFLCLKYHIYSCKFQNKRPTFSGFKIFVKNNRECEYIIARKRDNSLFI